ncbi:MAG: hypothetical protein ACREP8_15740, partial [Candidatus Binatia bacterium]
IKDMSSLQKVVLAAGALAVFGTGMWLYGYYGRLREQVYQARKVEVAEYIQRRAAQMIRPTDFAPSDGSHRGEAFETFFDAIQTPELFRIKVFSREPKIIWSNLKEIVGQDASANLDVQTALENGKVTLKFKSSKPEQISERQFRKFTETYVPIRSATGAIVGVIEVYQTAFRIEENIKKQFHKAAAIVLVVVLIGCCSVALAFYAGAGSYPRQNSRI